MSPNAFVARRKMLNNSLCYPACAGRRAEVVSCGSDQTAGRFRPNAQEGSAHTVAGMTSTCTFKIRGNKGNSLLGMERRLQHPLPDD